MANVEALTEAIQSRLRVQTSAHWLALFDNAGVPAGPVHTIGQALSHPQTLARGMVVEVDHPTLGQMQAVGCPIHFSDTPTQIDRAAPDLGQHTREILENYGYSATDIDALYQAGAVA